MSKYNDNLRVYWLSFVNPNTGDSLGACMVEVSNKDAAAVLRENPNIFDISEGPWMSAACQNAYKHSCNPGGQAAGFRIDTFGPDFEDTLERIPMHTLLTKEDCEELGLATERISGSELEELRSTDSGSRPRVRCKPEVLNPIEGGRIRTSLWD